jgi:hypothetical protein
MSERLSIRNFGPIQEAEIEVRDLTVFVGPQATGKSMAAQLLYFMRGIEDLLPLASNTGRRSIQHGDYNPHLETRATQDVITALEWWLGNHNSVYAVPGTSLAWCPSSAQESVTYDISWTEDKVFLNYFLEAWLGAYDRPRLERVSGQQIYIPAGRALYSYLSQALALPLLSRKTNRPDWPGYIFWFYQILGETIKSLSEIKETGQQLIFGPSVTPYILRRMEEILKGQISYGPNAILLKTGGQTLRTDTIAAGQMEAWPFFAVMENALRKGQAENLRVYFDEPEAHLHPGAQQKLMEIVAALVRGGTQMVITTHSPYILYALNNFLTASEVLSKRRPLPPEVSAETALIPQQIAAYCFSSSNKPVLDIMDREIGLINSDELNRVAEELGSDFTSMQEQLLEEGDQDV